MNEEAESFPMEIEAAERRIEHLEKKKKRKQEMMVSTENSEVPKLVKQADPQDTKKQVNEIKALERMIRFYTKRKKCLMVAMENSIDMVAAQRLVEQEEMEKQEIEGNLAERPAGENPHDSTVSGDPSLPPLPHRYPPYPKGCDLVEHDEWAQEYKRVQKLNAPFNNLPTQSIGHKDPATAAAVVTADDKMKLLRVADTVVNFFYPCVDAAYYPNLEDLNVYCTGLIISWDKDNKRARILTCSCAGITQTDTKRKLYVHWQYMEGTVVEAKLLFFSAHYQIALLEIAYLEMPEDVPLDIPSFGSSPKYGDEVFALARDKDLSLMVRCGEIMQLQESLDELRQGYLFVDYELPECGTGGPVVDCNGDVVGISFSCEEGISTILPISTARLCIDMWTKFGRIARPLIGMCFQNVEVPDELCGDNIRFDGLVVDVVDRDSTAWKLGIRSGNVIVSFDGQCPIPLPEFENFLLSCGLKHLHGTDTEVDFKLEIQEAPGVRRSITLRVPFSDGAKLLTAIPRRNIDQYKPLGFLISDMDFVKLLVHSDLFVKLPRLPNLHR